MPRDVFTKDRLMDWQHVGRWFLAFYDAGRAPGATSKEPKLTGVRGVWAVSSQKDPTHRTWRLTAHRSMQEAADSIRATGSPRWKGIVRENRERTTRTALYMGERRATARAERRRER